MNFDYGSLLIRAWQITWRHKAIWGLVILSILPSFLLFPLFLIPVFFLEGGGEAGSSDTTGLVLFILMPVIFIIAIAGNYVVGAAASSSATLGIVRAEHSVGSLRFMDLLRDGLAYFWRILGVMLFIGVTLLDKIPALQGAVGRGDDSVQQAMERTATFHVNLG